MTVCHQVRVQIARLRTQIEDWVRWRIQEQIDEWVHFRVSERVRQQVLNQIHARLWNEINR
jgi:hypothetical protein